MDDKKRSGLQRAGALLPALVENVPPPLTPIQERLISMPLDEQRSILYQHSVLCQTCLPYRDPSDEVRAWQRNNGLVSLRIQAGSAYDSSPCHLDRCRPPPRAQAAACSVSPEHRGPPDPVARPRAGRQPHGVRKAHSGT